MTLADTLRGILVVAFEKVGIAGADLDRVAVVAASDIRHGDYQSNAAMMLAKVAKKNPRALAARGFFLATFAKIIAALDW